MNEVSNIPEFPVDQSYIFSIPNQREESSTLVLLVFAAYQIEVPFLYWFINSIEYRNTGFT